VPRLPAPAPVGSPLLAALLVALGAAGGCTYTKKTVIYDTGAADGQDADGDGVTTPDDCDDGDPSVYPGAPELCDGKNNDCDAGVDEDPIDGRLFHVDNDDDGYGDPDIEVMGCARSPGFVEDGTDCDDSTDLVHPGMDEICNDGLDNDCDGAQGDCALSGNVSLEDAALTVLGGAGGDRAGSAAALVGDMDGDGVGELAVGAPYADPRGADSGAVYLLRGDLTGVVSLADAPHFARISGGATGHHAGDALSPAGDVNGDGYADLLIGATSATGGGLDSGEAFLFYGPVSGDRVMADADLQMIGELSYDLAGGRVGPAGDVDGDGDPDLLVGAEGYGDGGYQSQGAVYIVRGGLGGDVDLRDAMGRVEGPGRLDRLGSGLAGAGDLNGDGFADLVLGARSWSASDNRGAAFVIEGPIDGRMTAVDGRGALEGVVEGDAAGTAVAAADLDGDGYAELLIGAPGVSEGAGAVYVILGPGPDGARSLADAEGRVDGAGPGSGLGTQLTAEGDLDGDGRFDFIAGAPGDDRAATDAGAAFVFGGALAGAVPATDARLRLYGAVAGAGAGSAVSAGRDANGDASADVLIGAGAYGDSAVMRGAVSLVHGIGL